MFEWETPVLDREVPRHCEEEEQVPRRRNGNEYGERDAGLGREVIMRLPRKNGKGEDTKIKIQQD